MRVIQIKNIKDKVKGEVVFKFSKQEKLLLSPLDTYLPVSLSFLLCFFPFNRRKQPAEKKTKAVPKHYKKAY